MTSVIDLSILYATLVSCAPLEEYRIMEENNIPKVPVFHVVVDSLETFQAEINLRQLFTTSVSWSSSRIWEEIKI